MQYDRAETDRMVSGMLMAGTIEDVDYPNARVRVRSGSWVSAWLPWGSLAAGQVRHWRPPSVGEQALIMSPSGQPEQGMVMPGFYAEQHKQANDNRKEIVSWLMPDDTLFEYDWDKHEITVHAVGSARIRIAGSAHVSIGGNARVSVGGNAEVRIGGIGQILCHGKLLIKSLTRLILKGPTRTIIL